MNEMIRCSACRGTKQVAKLGGIQGDCDTCSGTGKIKACDKPVPVVVVQSELVSDIIEATDRAIDSSQDYSTPFATPEIERPIISTDSIINAVASVEPKPEPVKLKRKVFKRKVASK